MKFRVWDKTRQQMYYEGFRLSQSGELSYDIWCGHPNSNRLPSGELFLEVMFSTGIKDKDGREVYEGDILNTNWGSIMIFTLGILPELGWFRDNAHDLTVIGNRHQNPELLEQSDG